ncbi:26S proteasome regulatory subunit Rpn10p [Monosporozyma servazzii]
MLEAVVLCIDNSQYSRNGDFPRTRFEAQIDAIEYIFQAKRNSNLENTLALISSAGETTPQVLSTFTSQFGKILSGLNETMIAGDHIHFVNTIEMAALTLKHRQNKLQHQRIVMFICSPLSINQNNNDDDSLSGVASLLNEKKIALDIINFGEIDQNTTLLTEFIDTLNRNNTAGDDSKSHLLTVRPGPRLLYEHIATSPIILEESDIVAGIEGGDATGAMGAGSGGFMDFGVDPELDPELAMALRLSMEEEQQRQERIRQNEQQQSTDSNNNEQPNEENAEK